MSAHSAVENEKPYELTPKNSGMVPGPGYSNSTVFPENAVVKLFAVSSDMLVSWQQEGLLQSERKL